MIFEDLDSGQMFRCSAGILWEKKGEEAAYRLDVHGWRMYGTHPFRRQGTITIVNGGRERH